MELTPEQLEAYLKGELEEGSISSPYNPDGIFESIEEKRKIIEYLQKKNSFPNQ
jgi:hypothetical protein